MDEYTNNYNGGFNGGFDENKNADSVRDTQQPAQSQSFNVDNTSGTVNHAGTANQSDVGQMPRQGAGGGESTYSFTGSQLPKDDTVVFSASSGFENNQTGQSVSGSFSGTESAHGYGSSYFEDSRPDSTGGYTGAAGYGNTNQQPQGGYSYGGSPAGGYSGQYGGYNTAQTQPAQNVRQPKAPKKKKAKKPVTRGSIAAVLIIAIVCSAAMGFGGGYAATKLFGGSGVVVNQSSGATTPGVASSAENTGALTTSQIADKVSGSVVEITTETVTTGSFFQQYVAQGAGSGVIISEDGYLLTNNHVIDGANNIQVELIDNSQYEATVIGRDAKLDIALLKIDATGLTPATFGDSSALKVGDYSVAIGNPLGALGGTVTDGIISALDRDVIVDGETMRLLQTNAAINPGNSGGGLFNAQGELIGIVCAKASSSATEVEGLGFAIPINEVLNVLNDLKQYGYVQGRIDLGMTLTDVNSNTVYQKGVYVKSVTQNSNAQKAGFKSGDLITKVNGTEVASVADVDNIIDSLNVGDNVTFSVTRGTKSGDLTFTLAEYSPENDTLTDESNDRGLSQYGGDSIWDYFNR